MSLSNYRDLSTSSTDLNAGFQFEFFCERCGSGHRTPFKPYRKGQVTGWLSRFAFMFADLQKASRATGAFADAGASSAKAAALEEARAQAAAHFRRCERCNKQVDTACWNEAAGRCSECAGRAAADTPAAHAQSGPSCPNCQVPSLGGRFCHECGFDMASTHKSCPACGVTVARQARFCTDCGHGF